MIYKNIKNNIVLSVLFLGASIMTLGFVILYPTFFLKRIKIGNSVSFHDGTVRVSVELAADPYQWSKGLMFRESLEKDAGMLFVFPKEEQRSFWMKNTLIPLDIIFITKDKRVVTVQKNATPCTTLLCTHYSSTGNAMYVLEVNAGFADTHGIQEGDLVEITEQ